MQRIRYIIFEKSNIRLKLKSEGHQALKRIDRTLEYVYSLNIYDHSSKYKRLEVI